MGGFCHVPVCRHFKKLLTAVTGLLSGPIYATTQQQDGGSSLDIYHLMYLSRGLRHGPRRPIARAIGNIRSARGIVTDADVESARKYCVNQLRSAVSILFQFVQYSNLLLVGRVTTTHTSSANSYPAPPKMPTMLCEPSTSSLPVSRRLSPIQPSASFVCSFGGTPSIKPLLVTLLGSQSQFCSIGP